MKKFIFAHKHRSYLSVSSFFPNSPSISTKNLLLNPFTWKIEGNRIIWNKKSTRNLPFPSYINLIIKPFPASYGFLRRREISLNILESNTNINFSACATFFTHKNCSSFVSALVWSQNIDVMHSEYFINIFQMHNVDRSQCVLLPVYKRFLLNHLKRVTIFK